MYGLKQAPLLWNKHIHGTLTEIGFKRHAGEYGLYFRDCKDGIALVALVALYVDDLLITSPSPEVTSKIKNALNRYYSMKDLGQVKKFLGLNIEQDDKKVSLSLHDYICQAASSSGVDTSRTVTTPLSKDIPIFDDQSPPLPDITVYQSIVGQLLFISNTGRPDVAHSISLLSRFLKDPREIHLRAAHRVMQYLYATRHHGLVYHMGSPIELQIYSDASHGSTTDIPHATRGYILPVMQCRREGDVCSTTENTKLFNTKSFGSNVIP